MDPAGIELELANLAAGGDNNKDPIEGEEIEEEDDLGCDLNMESHRNYNTPEELKKRDASQLIIPGSLVNAGNPSEKRIQNINESIQEMREGG